ncbi:MAG TPA: alpha/beta fold hydrolase [Steroidobacteraceae bacterium]|nr:alpha/beta fold hydrolase [Steroidobacteraceae bacterium]
MSPEAPAAAGRFPLAVISHGGGGSPLLYRTLSTYLTRHGWAVACPRHPGNSLGDNALGESDETLASRPRHIHRVIDAMYADAALGGSLLPAVAVIGHSMGGYTALAVAGGVPWTRERRRIQTVTDDRVRALVLMAPAAAFFAPAGSLAGVTAPILLLTAEHDLITPAWQADIVQQGVPDPRRVTRRTIPNAGHFSFLSPFPPPMRNAGFPPSQDPPGFDREAFHRTLPAEILAWLQAHLAPAAG